MPSALRSLTLALNQVPYVPGLIGRLNLFEEKRLSTTTTMIEVRGERLALVPERPRGAPPTPDVHDGASLIPVGHPALPGAHQPLCRRRAERARLRHGRSA